MTMGRSGVVYTGPIGMCFSQKPWVSAEEERRSGGRMLANWRSWGLLA
jgi:hypothetical protein